MLQVSEIILNSRALVGTKAQTLPDCSSARKRRARNKSFQSLGQDFLMTQFSTQSEEGLARKKVKIDVPRRKLLKQNGPNGVLRFSWWNSARTCL